MDDLAVNRWKESAVHVVKHSSAYIPLKSTYTLKRMTSDVTAKRESYSSIVCVTILNTNVNWLPLNCSMNQFHWSLSKERLRGESLTSQLLFACFQIHPRVNCTAENWNAQDRHKISRLKKSNIHSSSFRISRIQKIVHCFYFKEWLH